MRRVYSSGWIIPFWMWLMWQGVKVTSVMIFLLVVAAVPFRHQIAPLWCWLIALFGAYVIVGWTRAYVRWVRSIIRALGLEENR